MKKLLLLGSLVVIAGCSSLEPTYTSSGSAGWRAKCAGFLDSGDTSTCYKMAGDTCAANGYSVVSSGLSSLIFVCNDPGAAKSDLK